MFCLVATSVITRVVMVSVVNVQYVKVQSVMANIVSQFALSVKIQRVIVHVSLVAPIVTTTSAMVANLSLHPHNVLNGAHVLSVMLHINHINLVITLVHLITWFVMIRTPILAPSCNIIYGLKSPTLAEWCNTIETIKSIKIKTIFLNSTVSLVLLLPYSDCRGSYTISTSKDLFLNKICKCGVTISYLYTSTSIH
jgi:hypothetical protein